MATTLGPELARDASHLSAMDSRDNNPMHHNATLADDSQPRGGPPPNPVFSFPARPDGSPSTPMAAPSPAPGRTRTRRPMSAIDVPGRLFPLGSDNPDIVGRAALPAFSFNPGAALSPDSASLLSPPITPDFPRAIPSAQRPAGHGHRRGGSEFVGGRLRDGNSIAVMGTSPTRDESGFASPDFKLPQPRRGHRRGVSSAISSNDIPLLTPPSAPFMTTKGNSAPNSPTNFEQPNPMSAAFQDQPTPPSDTPAEKIELATYSEPPEVSPVDKMPPKPPTRTRVGFSDTLEFIPRPLSLVSTDTSSTITARPMHSVSDSITSMISITEGRGSPVTLSRSPTRELDDECRPSTAGAILDRMSLAQGGPGPEITPRRRNSIPALYDVGEVQHDTTPAAVGSGKPKRWTFFGLEPFSHSHPSAKGRPRSSSSGESVTRAVSGSSSEHGSESPAETELSAPKTKKTKRKKVKGWAGAILPIKSKSEKRSKHPVRPPTPPASIIPPDEDDDEEEALDEGAMQTTPSVTVTLTESTTPPRPKLPRQLSEDTSLSMIDLDAALGPFNTPLPHNPEWEAAQKAAGNNNRRRLHSAQGMKGFSGPGMHYHRRAESAPDLPPFEGGRASIHRFGSSSTMADVFEEDEEDEGQEQHSRKSSSQESKISDCTDGDTTPPAGPTDAPLAKPPAIIHRKSSALSERDQSSVHSLRLERSRTSLQDTVIAEGSPSVRFNTINVFQQSASTSGSPRMSPRNKSSYNELSPVDIGPPHAPYTGNAPVSPYSMSHASSFPSPRSPMSMDAQRISTAPSSINDENSFRSLLMGEPGPEVRLSTDYDIPSLTSSTSTMTRDSNLTPQVRMSQPTLREPRPLSVSSTAFGRRRSSLASLSRLISSSHGERSKLSEEVILDNEADTKKAKSSKSKRLGRFVQFWKPTKPEPTG